MKKVTIKNAHGVDVVKCCASCIYNAGIGKKSLMKRQCGNGEGDVFPFDSCRDWVMHPRYQSAGIGGGNVKKKKYLQYVLDNYLKLSIHDLRHEYERKYGSRIYF